MTDEELELASADAVKFVKRALVLNLICVLVAVAVLLIDQGIKRAVLDATARARKTLADFDLRVAEVNYGPAGTPEARADRDGSDPGVDAGGVVVHAAAAGAVLDQAPVAGPAAPGGGPDGVADGAPGDG